MNNCLSIKGAEDALNKPHAFEITTSDDRMFFIADSDKVGLFVYCEAGLLDTMVCGYVVLETHPSLNLPAATECV